jgi:hypothetical protein
MYPGFYDYLARGRAGVGTAMVGSCVRIPYRIHAAVHPADRDRPGQRFGTVRRATLADVAGPVIDFTVSIILRATLL